MVREALENLGPHAGAVTRYDRPFAPGRHDALGKTAYQMAVYASDGAIVPVEGSP
jgi:branched-chain amino acid transport system substrate-binding protein